MRISVCGLRIAEFKTQKQHRASILRPALLAALSRWRSGLDYGRQVAPAYAKAAAGKHSVKAQS